MGGAQSGYYLGTGCFVLADTVQSQSAACDGKDHGTTPARLNRLQDEAHAFNQLLRVNEANAHGKKHAQVASEANKEFFAFLPGSKAQADSTANTSSGTLAFEASKALYEQASALPIGERKALLKAAVDENTAMAAKDPALPVLTVSMDANAFIDTLDVAYREPSAHDKTGKATSYVRGEVFTFHYLGMCAEFSTPGPNDPPQVTGSRWSIDLPHL